MRDSSQLTALSTICKQPGSVIWFPIKIYGLVNKSVIPLFIFWITFSLDLELNFIGKILVFRWELIVLLLLQMCFFFVMK